MGIESGLKGKVVLVTGGSRGIGRAIVERFAADGADVTFFYRGNEVAAREVLDAVDRVTNRRLVRRIEGRRAGDPDSLISDNQRIKATLPWQPRHADLDTIVAHALAWERRLGEIRQAG